MMRDDGEGALSFEDLEPEGSRNGRAKQMPSSPFPRADLSREILEGEAGPHAQPDPEFEYDEMLEPDLDAPEPEAGPAREWQAADDHDSNAATVRAANQAGSQNEQQQRRLRRPQPMGRGAQLDDPLPPHAGALLREQYRLMQLLAREAAASPNLAEASTLLAAAVTLALAQAPLAQRALLPLVPVLVRSTLAATAHLYRQPHSRPRLQAMPRVLWQTVAELARRVESGHKITAEFVRRQMARELSQTFQLLEQSAEYSKERWDGDDAL
jgi:hypothetical protein